MPEESATGRSKEDMIIEQNLEVEAELDERKKKYLNDFNEEGQDVSTIET